MTTAATGSPLARPIRRAAAADDVACDDGKLNLLGVETPIRTDGCVGRLRREMRLTTIDAA